MNRQATAIEGMDNKGKNKMKGYKQAEQYNCLLQEYGLFKNQAVI